MTGVVVALRRAALALLAVGLLLGLGARAEAQPAGQPAVRIVEPGAARPTAVPQPGAAPVRVMPGDVRGAAAAVATPAEPASVTSLHGDTTRGSSKGLALMFWMFAAACIGGALFVITRANLITAVMGMVGTFLAIAAVYMLLFASFLAVVQVLVYAGAIMVLFVFVIMVLNRPEDEPFASSGRLGKGLAVAGLGYLLLRLVMVVWKVSPPATALVAPAQVDIGVVGKGGARVPDLVDWGSTQAVGKELFTDSLFPFEAVSILLLIAVVGAIAIARPLDPGTENPGDNPGPEKA